MTSSFFAAILAILVISAYGSVSRRSRTSKRRYYNGVKIWSQWAPVIATGFYLAVLTVNLASGGATSERLLSLDGFFSTPEIIALFLLGPVFVTRPGNLAAVVSCLYLMLRMLLSHNPSSSSALYIVLGSATMVAVLGDRMPWLSAEGPSPLATRLRSVLLALLTTASLSTIFFGLVHVHSFDRWLNATFALAVPNGLAIIVLCLLFLGWMTVGLGMTRNLIIPMLSLPTLLVLAFVTGWAAHLLVLPFALCLALSLSTAERRRTAERRGPAMNGTVVLS